MRATIQHGTQFSLKKKRRMEVMKRKTSKLWADHHAFLYTEDHTITFSSIQMLTSRKFHFTR